MNKTQEQANDFAKTLPDDDAAVFLEMFQSGNVALIQGHFPQFGLEAEVTPSAPEAA